VIETAAEDVKMENMHTKPHASCAVYSIKSEILPTEQEPNIRTGA
jgi:hypothetical protein